MNLNEELLHILNEGTEEEKEILSLAVHQLSKNEKETVPIYLVL